MGKTVEFKDNPDTGYVFETVIGDRKIKLSADTHMPLSFLSEEGVDVSDHIDFVHITEEQPGSESVDEIKSFHPRATGKYYEAGEYKVTGSHSVENFGLPTEVWNTDEINNRAVEILDAIDATIASTGDQIKARN